MKEQGKDPMTFTIGFDQWAQSEDVFAREVAAYVGLKNEHGMIKQEAFLNHEIIAAWDEPIADISIIPTFYLTQLASKSYKVVLSGDGADELLGGYNWYYEVARQMQDTKKSFFVRPKFHKQAFDTYCRYSAMGLYDKALLRETLHPDFHRSIPEDIFWLYKQHFDTSLPVIKALQLLDIRTFLPELILPKMDRASMAHSVEVRPAFLDHRIAEEIFSHESSYYFDPDQYKKLLYKELKGKVPEQILSRKKQGFTGPDSYYDRPEYYRNLFKNSHLVEEGIINKEIIEKFITEKMPWHLWKLAVLEIWVTKFYA
jgi:asparagine synthase (glutamine-hydrolysing)